MWVLMNDSMLSIVRHKYQPDSLLIRARLAGDIERVVPHAQVVEGAGCDYRLRATLSQQEVADAVAHRLLDFDYGNFKSSFREPTRHDGYVKVWDTLYTLREQAGSHEHSHR